jgi:hypothetical protein
MPGVNIVVCDTKICMYGTNDRPFGLRPAGTKKVGAEFELVQKNKPKHAKRKPHHTPHTTPPPPEPPENAANTGSTQYTGTQRHRFISKNTHSLTHPCIELRRMQ